ncbi:MAG: hypothetical protein AAGA85_21060, partial [Bacteroidota bacterium]
MNKTLTLLLILLQVTGYGQSTIDWTDDYELQLSDFASPQTEINPDLTSFLISPGTKMDFGFQMSSIQFMMTKNFNSKVKTSFNRQASVIAASDSALAYQLVKWGQFNFDLTELYTRRF